MLISLPFAFFVSFPFGGTKGGHLRTKHPYNPASRQGCNLKQNSATEKPRCISEKLHYSEEKNHKHQINSNLQNFDVYTLSIFFFGLNENCSYFWGQKKWRWCSVFFTRFLTALHFTGSRKWLILNINEIPHSAIATFGMTTTAKKERRSGGGDAQIQNEYQAFAAAASSQTPTYMSFRRSEATEESQAISNT